jgi:hypothetical protein
MSTPLPRIATFVLRTALWLAPCFAAWYLAARFHGIAAGEAARALVLVLKPGLVSALERQGSDLVFVTTLLVHPAPGETGVLVTEVNPLLYTYGLPLFVALMLAARASGWKIVAGAALLLPLQAWGIAFDFLAQVGIRAGPAVSAQAGLAGWPSEAVALAYQAGSLLFPALVPVLLWGAFNRPLIARIAESRTVGGAKYVTEQTAAAMDPRMGSSPRSQK